jgi:SAM-dependent methyltransferase
VNVGIAENVQAAITERVAAVGFPFDFSRLEVVHACPLCGNSGRGASKYIGERDRYGIEQWSEMCSDCGFVYLSPRMTRADYGEFYEKWYRPLVSAYAGFTVDAREAQKAQQGYANQVCAIIERYACHPARRTAIDVGGSTGDFAALLTKTWGYQCTVLDPAPDELAIAAQSGAKVVAGLVEDFETDEKFDIVSCLQTVDHLLDPVGALQKFRQWITPHGLLVIDFVDYLVYARRFGIEHAIKIDHPCNFTEETAAVLLARTGFEPILAHRSHDYRHILFACRPVPALPNAMSSPESVNALWKEFAEVAP